MLVSIGCLDEKTTETEFFLQRMCSSGLSDFRFYLSAFLSASRTVTLALQRLKNVPNFAAWYKPHREKLAASKLSQYFKALRDEHVHGGLYPIGGTMSYKSEIKHYFIKDPDFPTPPDGFEDLVTAAREYFIELLSIVYDCYVSMGPQIDPQQYFSEEHYPGDIDLAEIMIWGFIRTSFIEDGMTPSDRWHELRGYVGECQINHLFFSYLGKVTPQPMMPEEFADFDYTPEEKGWIHTPAGFSSLEEYFRLKNISMPD